MGKKINHYNEIIILLGRLHKSHPNYTLGQHIDTAASDYKDIWSISDKELLFALEKYEAELELDLAPDIMDIDKIVKDGTNLTLENEDDEEYYDDL